MSNQFAMQGGVVKANPVAGPSQAIPFLDLKQQFNFIRKDVISAVIDVLESQHFILGKEVEAFELELTPLLGSRFAVSCGSGSDALLLALLASEIGRGDEVITTPFTFVATAGSIARAGARPVFVDIERDTYNIDPSKIEKAITARTRAIMPVHIFGFPADMDPILEIAAKHKLVVIEDAAQAIGTRYRGKAVGNLGAFGCFSFFPSKNLGAAGDGGLVTTDDSELADRLKILRVHGSRQKYEYECLGMNSRLDALQAAILRVKLRFLEQWTARRQENASNYRSLFQEFNLSDTVQLPATSRDRTHTYNQFVVRVPKRDALRLSLRSKGIQTEVYYPSPLHLQRAFAYLDLKKGDFPESEAASQEVLALPIFPELNPNQQRAVVAAIADFYCQQA